MEHMVSGCQINLTEYWKTESYVEVSLICMLCAISLGTNEALKGGL